MPVTASGLGVWSQPWEQEIDARWLMAYAAGIGDCRAVYLDTTRAGGIVAHPVFPVAVEWEPILRQRFEPGFPGELSLAERARGVHAAHDLHVHRPIRPGDRLRTRMRLIGVFRGRPGAFQVTHLETVDAGGAPVCTTYMTTLLRGVALSGPEQRIEKPPALPSFAAAARVDLEVPIEVHGSQAHVYTECARIWAPIHTDRAVALSAGLPGLILQGTCTLALAVSELVNRFTDGPERVSRLGCRFSAMVEMPSAICLRAVSRVSDGIAFEVIARDGKSALADGYMCWRNDVE